MPLNANEFVALLSSLVPAFRQTSVRFQPSLGGERGGGSVYVNFVNLPPDVGRSGGGAEAENNRASFWVNGFAHDPTLPAATVKVEQAASVFHRPWLGAPGVPFRAKSGSPEVVARYLAAYLAKVVEAVPPRFTHSLQEGNRQTFDVWWMERDAWARYASSLSRAKADALARRVKYELAPRWGLPNVPTRVVPHGESVVSEARGEVGSSTEETVMSRKSSKSRREPTPKQEGEQIVEAADKAGADYANEQVGGDHFRDWVYDQVAEAERMRASDPDSVFPSDTPDGAKRAARNMLQQLEWDTKRQMDQREILELSGATGVFNAGSEDWVRDTYGITVKDVTDAFFAAFDEALRAPAIRQWLTDLVLEINEDVRGVRKSKLAQERGASAARGAKRASEMRRVAAGISPARHLANDIVRVIMKEPDIAPYGLAVRFGLEGRVAREILDLAQSSFGPGGEGFEAYAKKVEKIILRKRVIREAHRPLVRDYVPVDSRGRPLSPPTKDYEKAKRQADKAGGVVKFKVGRQSAAHEAHRVRDYVPVDTRGRPLSPPTKDYEKAKREADRAGGVVKFSAARGARERLRPRTPSRGRGGR